MLLRLADSDERTLVNRAKAIAAVVQPRDIALLLDGRPDIAIRAGADGAHLTGIAALTAALGALKPDRIAGAGGLRSRHDAMLAAEAGADYVMFGEPDRSAASENQEPPGLRHRAGADRLVGGTVPAALRRLRRKPRRGRRARASGRRFRRAG